MTLNQTMTNMIAISNPLGQASSSSSGGVLNLLVRPGNELGVIHDSLNRVVEALSAATSQCITTARVLNEEGMRVKAAADAIMRATKQA